MAGLAMAVLAVGTARADGPATAPADSRYAGNIANADSMIAALNDECQRLVSDAKEDPEGVVLGDDPDKAKKFYDDLVQHYQHAIDDWSANDDAAAQKVMADIQTLLQQKDIWRLRMTQFRRAQADAVPTEQWFNDTAAVTQAGAKPALDKLLEAKKAASKAWGTVAEAAVPGADPKLIDDLKDKAVLAGVEVEIATWQWSWANNLAGCWTDKSITRDEIDGPLSALEKAQANCIAIRRQQAELEQQFQHAMQDLNKKQDEAFRAIWTARAAHAQAAATQPTASTDQGK